MVLRGTAILAFLVIDIFSLFGTSFANLLLPPTTPLARINRSDGYCANVSMGEGGNRARCTSSSKPGPLLKKRRNLK